MINKLYVICVVMALAINANAQTKKNERKLELGLLLNYSTPKQPNVDLTTALRVNVPVFKKIAIGTEVNYTQFFGNIGNLDYLGNITYLRFNPYKGFIGELGYSYNQIISSPRQNFSHTKGVYVAIGYKVQVSKSVNIDFQYRALPMKYLENGVINSKIYLLGLSYKFK